MADEIPEDVAFLEVTKNGVVHRVPVTPEQARRWMEGEERSASAVGSRSWTRTVAWSSGTACPRTRTRSA
jgi:hypothetical protein